ncbi:aspartate kinase [Melghirimyces algeriensis]|uniref:aspartate kinase n=1 Tax=Melghirimyces algeriensis TaxID=910412 RepID=A0A521D6Z8_9BACL|nr:aspartate kinase [Melghirimyces algeriensis]SMO66851.1 aspartate kinase [Melghirimyces algeriensis]
MTVQILKFGGTSLLDHQRRISAVSQVKKSLRAGFTPVVVVSAIGRRENPYSTDQLLSLLKNPSARNYTLLATCGEIISATLFSNMLEREQIDSICLTGGEAGIFTTRSVVNSSVLYVDSTETQQHIQNGYVPVIAGFQGRNVLGDITTLSRGGSDTTAAAIGLSLHADEIVLFTDVPGILTADPHIVREAKVVPRLSYEAARLLASKGAGVLHEESISWAFKAGIPMRITRFDCFDSSLGTWIGETVQQNGKDPFFRFSVTSQEYEEGYARITIVFEPRNRPVDMEELLKEILCRHRGISCTHYDGYVEIIVPTLQCDGVIFLLHNKLTVWQQAH